MDQPIIAREGHGDKGEGRIVALNGGGFVVPSFTNEGVAYKTHPESGYCSCPRHFHKGSCEKHVAFAASVAAIRGREAKTKSFLPTRARINEDKALRLSKAIFSKVERGECVVESYELLLEVRSFRFASAGMLRQAHKRHGQVLILHGVGPRRAA